MTTPDPTIWLGTDIAGRAQKTGLERYDDALRTELLAREDPLTYRQFAFEAGPEGSGDIQLVGRSRRWVNAGAMAGFATPIDAIVGAGALVHLGRPLPVKTQLPLVVTIHDVAPLIMPELYQSYTPRVFKQTIRLLNKQRAHFIVVSNCTGDDLMRFCKVPPERITCVYEGIAPRFRPNNGDNQPAVEIAGYGLPERYFLFIGAMNRRKNLTTLLHAFAKFCAADLTNTKLVIAGRTNWGGSETQQLIESLGLADHVVFPGYIDDDELPTVIAGARALVYPSLYEGFGFPPLEAMACGTPAIVADNSALPEATGRHALMVPTMDVDGYTAAMTQIAQDDALYDRLVDEGLVWAARFTWERTAAETFAVYKRVIAAGRR